MITETSPLLKSRAAETPKSYRSKLAETLGEVTVEPAILLHSIAYAADQVYLTNIKIDKICLNQFNYSAEICESLDTGNYTLQQDQVQRVAADYNVYCHWAEYLPAIISMVILGAWGDTRGRRLPVVLPFIGSLFSSLCVFANVYWWTLPTPFIILALIPLGVAGGNLGLSMNTCAYLSTMSKKRSRTFRLSSTEWIKMGCYPLGIYVSMLLFGYGGYLAVFSFEILLYFIAGVYLIVRLKEPPSTREQGSQAKITNIGQVLSPSRLKRTFTVICRPRESGGRTTLIFQSVILLFLVFMLGAKNYFYLYTRKKFDWNYQDYSDWTVVDYLVKAIGVLLVVPTLSYYCRVEDNMLIFIGGVSAMFYYVMFGTAPVAWVLYLASAVSMCVTIPVAASKGAISKVVSMDELGSMFSLLAVTQCIMLLIAPSLYTFIYNLTLEFFPGTLFLMMAGVAAEVCCISVWMLTHHLPGKE
nr:solute carrier family 46 member 3-like [Cherax quadricarinatus]XP_053642889.1 solute carrier family 46 member 3-like [Cherax quadricarinatus]